MNWLGKYLANSLSHRFWRIAQFALLVAGSGLLVTTACRKAESSFETEFRALSKLLQVQAQLRNEKKDDTLIFQIDDLMIDEVANVARKRSIDRLSEQELRMLQVLKEYWQEYPPAPRDLPFTEEAWKTAQSYLQCLPPLPKRPSNPAQHPAVLHGYRPRILRLLCSDAVSGKSITNLTVSFEGPGMFVSVYPDRANSNKVECRFVLNGIDPPRWVTNQTRLNSGGFSPSIALQFTIHSTNYVDQIVTIPANDFDASKVMERNVSLAPIR